jgi:hypothetical protein
LLACSSASSPPIWPSCSACWGCRSSAARKRADRIP